MKGVFALVCAVLVFLCVQQTWAECITVNNTQTYVMQEDTDAVAGCIILNKNSTLDCNFHSINIISPNGVRVGGTDVTVTNCVFNGNSTLTIAYANVVLSNNVFTGITTNATAIKWTGLNGQLISNTFTNITCVTGSYGCGVVDIKQPTLIENNVMTDIVGYFKYYFLANNNAAFNLTFRGNVFANITMPDKNEDNTTHCTNSVIKSSSYDIWIVRIDAYGAFYNNKFYNITSVSYPDCYNATYPSSSTTNTWIWDLFSFGGATQPAEVYDNEIYDIKGGRMGKQIYGAAWPVHSINVFQLYGTSSKQTAVSRVYNNYIHDIKGYYDAGGSYYGAPSPVYGITSLVIGLGCRVNTAIEVFNNTVNNLYGSGGGNVYDAKNSITAGAGGEVWGIYYYSNINTHYAKYYNNSITNIFAGNGGDSANATSKGGSAGVAYGYQMSGYYWAQNASYTITDSTMGNIYSGKRGNSGTITTSYGLSVNAQLTNYNVKAVFARFNVYNVSYGFATAYQLTSTVSTYYFKNICYSYAGPLGGCCSSEFETLARNTTCNSALCEKTARVCDGVNPECSAGTTAVELKEAGTICRVASGTCDEPDVCDGVSGDCPEIYKNTSVQCKVATACSYATQCSGKSKTCPSTIYQNSSFLCRESTGDCDLPEYCTGYSSNCPTDKVLNSSVICRAAYGDCDITDYCDGTKKDCPADKVANTTLVCRAAVSGGCDAPDTCNGINKTCPADAKFNSTVVCRAAAGPCDAVEYCDGVANECPKQKYLDASNICRAATSPCDSEERCLGNSPNCPGDSWLPENATCLIDGNPSSIKCTTGLCWDNDCVLGGCAAIEGGACSTAGLCVCADARRTFPDCTGSSASTTGSESSDTTATTTASSTPSPTTTTASSTPSSPSTTDSATTSASPTAAPATTTGATAADTTGPTTPSGSTNAAQSTTSQAASATTSVSATTVTGQGVETTSNPNPIISSANLIAIVWSVNIVALCLLVA